MADHNLALETTLLDGRVRCMQPDSGYRTSIDTVLVAAAVQAKPGERVLDVGAGAGAAGLCVAVRAGGVLVNGIEIQDEFVDLARRNADLNGLAQQVEFFQGDIGNPPELIRADSYDHVLSNPPFVVAGRGRVPPDASKALATMEGSVTLDGWITFCIRMAKTRGTITIIHRADRIEDILSAMKGRVGDLVVYPLWPGGDKPDQPARRVIVQGRKGAKGPSTLAKGMVLHNPGGAYTRQANHILLDAGPLEIER